MSYKLQGLSRCSNLYWSGEESIVLLVVGSDSMLSAISSLHHQGFVSISVKETDVTWGAIELEESIDVGFETVGLVA